MAAAPVLQARFGGDNVTTGGPNGEFWLMVGAMGALVLFSCHSGKRG